MGGVFAPKPAHGHGPPTLSPPLNFRLMGAKVKRHQAHVSWVSRQTQQAPFATISSAMFIDGMAPDQPAIQSTVRADQYVDGRLGNARHRASGAARGRHHGKD